jgi:uncharacterized protein YbaP (TraB family)
MRITSPLLALLLVSTAASPGALPMWSIETNGKHVDILGSIHFLRPGKDQLPPAALEACAKADVVVMEIDLDEIDPLAAQATMQQLGMDPAGRTLDAILGPRDYALAEQKAKAAGLDLGALKPFEPWLAALTITQLELVKLGLDASSGVEQQVLALAHRDEKDVRGLETLEEQLSSMDSLSAKAQREFLMQTLDDAASMEEEIDSIVDAWKSGDARTLEDEFLDELKDQPEIYRRIVVDRNRRWAAQLRPLLQDRNNYLIVVGTLHLVGPDSLIGLLRKAGFDPRQVVVDTAEDSDAPVE